MGQITLNQINIGPNVALGRRGCVLEDGKNMQSDDFYAGTPFHDYYKAFDRNERLIIKNFVRDKFPEILSICRKSYLNKFDEIDGNNDVISKLKKYGVLDEDLNLKCKLESFGNLFECVVGDALRANNIQFIREAKIRYPFPNKPYDPDGQLYDILGALDLYRLIWIECKKPLYLSDENPLGQVLSRNNIEKFIRRAFFLKPDIAVYLVDTKEDFRKDIRKLFNTDFLTSGQYVDYFKDSDNLMARLNGFIYFVRANHKSNNLYFEGLKNSISQVLYDATRIKGGNKNLSGIFK